MGSDNRKTNGKRSGWWRAISNPNSIFTFIFNLCRAKARRHQDRRSAHTPQQVKVIAGPDRELTLGTISFSEHFIHGLQRTILNLNRTVIIHLDTVQENRTVLVKLVTDQENPTVLKFLGTTIDGAQNPVT
jgi:hypothetical protein